MKQKKTSVAAIIPARYASTRFPGKPLFPIQGKTLIQHTYENTRRCSFLDSLIVATDDTRIYDHVLSFGGHAVMTPENCPTGSDRLAYVIERDPLLKEAEIIINVQGDEPCLDPETLRKVVEILRSDDTAVMSTAIFPLTAEEAHNPNVVKCAIDLQGNALYFSRALIPSGHSQKFSEGNPYYKHIGIYAFRPWFLLRYAALPMTPLQKAEDLEQLKVLEHGYKIKAALIHTVSPDVNTLNDIKKVEQLLCKQNSSLSQAESVPL